MWYLLVASFMWGTSFVAAKYAEAVTDVVLIVLLRLAIASLFVIPLISKYFKSINKGMWIKLIAVSFLTYPATFLLQFIGVHYTTASNAAVMIGFEPLLIVCVGHYFFQEKASPKDLILGFSAFIGILFVIGMPNSNDLHVFGCFLVFLSTVVVAIWVRWSKKIMQEVPDGSYTSITLFLGFITSIPCALLFVNDWSFKPDPAGIGAILYLGLGCSLLAGWAWNKGLKRLNANTSGLYLALEPVFGVMFGVLLLGDYFDLLGILGISIVLFSLFSSVVISLRTSTPT